MKSNWIKPNSSSLSAYQRSYVDLVPEGDLPELLEEQAKQTSLLLSTLTPDKLKYRYAVGKWSVPQMLVHIIDTERIFSYRVLCIARGDKTPLPGYEENDYAKASYADERNFNDIVQEYLSVRKATIHLFNSLNDQLLSNTGISNKTEVSVRLLCYILAGHELHHIKVLKDKYL